MKFLFVCATKAKTCEIWCKLNDFGFRVVQHIQSFFYQLHKLQQQQGQHRGLTDQIPYRAGCHQHRQFLVCHVPPICNLELCRWKIAYTITKPWGTPYSRGYCFDRDFPTEIVWLGFERYEAHQSSAWPETFICSKDGQASIYGLVCQKRINPVIQLPYYQYRFGLR